MGGGTSKNVKVKEQNEKNIVSQQQQSSQINQHEITVIDIENSSNTLNEDKKKQDKQNQELQDKLKEQESIQNQQDEILKKIQEEQYQLELFQKQYEEYQQKQEEQKKLIEQQQLELTKQQENIQKQEKIIQQQQESLKKLEQETVENEENLIQSKNKLQKQQRQSKLLQEQQEKQKIMDQSQNNNNQEMQQDKKEQLEQAQKVLNQIKMQNKFQKLKVFVNFNFAKQFLIQRDDVIFISEQQAETSNYDYKWIQFPRPSIFSNFQPGRQIISHIQNIKYILCQKDDLITTFQQFDTYNLYNFNSTDIHFKTYVFDMERYSYNQTELQFFQEDNKGIWISKDPGGCRGKGICLYKGAAFLQQQVKRIKNAHKNTYQFTEGKRLFTVIQKYLERPLLMNSRKVDYRGHILIASLDPFVVLYQDGFVRQCIEKYDNDFINYTSNESFKHITNVCYQEKHKNYNQLKDQIVITYKEFEQYLRDFHNLSDAKLKEIDLNNKKVVAYAIMAAKSKIRIQKGVYQLMGFDIMWDSDYKTYFIEINHCPGMHTDTRAHKKIFPNMLSQLYDIILTTMSDQTKTRYLWQNQESLNLGDWQVLMNDATGYNILDQFKN